MSFFAPVTAWTIPLRVWDRSVSELCEDGREHVEGIVFWLGLRRSAKAEITHAVLLRGPGVIRRPDLVRVSDELLNKLTDVAIDLGVVLVGQIHSHGPYAGVDLSATDRRGGIRVSGYLSVVAPDFAQGEHIDLSDCGVHVYEDMSGYRRLADQECKEMVFLTTERYAAILTVGEEDEQ
jgi:hypothetical protein